MTCKEGKKSGLIYLVSSHLGRCNDGDAGLCGVGELADVVERSQSFKLLFLL